LVAVPVRDLSGLPSAYLSIQELLEWQKFGFPKMKMALSSGMSNGGNMRSIMLMAFSFFFAFNVMAQSNFCAQYAEQKSYQEAIQSVATAMKYTHDQLCTLPTLTDIYMSQTVLYSTENLPIDHLSVTLHYETYSCQYFVRASDKVITRKSCYNTW
jgi:hypothetical protein